MFNCLYSSNMETKRNYKDSISKTFEKDLGILREGVKKGLHKVQRLTTRFCPNRRSLNCILKSRSRKAIPSAWKEERQLSFLGLMAIKSPVLSKRLITCGKCKTHIRGRGRQFTRTDSISGKVNCSKREEAVQNSSELGAM